MPEPINPQDHTISGYEPEDYMALGVRRRADERSSFSTLATIEAIHQTFERDAEWWEGVENYRAKRAVWDAIEGGVHGDGYSTWKNTPDGREHTPTHPASREPDTEIDRLARLIVDGEYRRRKETQS
jgi:hypothetical protein